MKEQRRLGKITYNMKLKYPSTSGQNDIPGEEHKMAWAKNVSTSVTSAVTEDARNETQAVFRSFCDGTTAHGFSHLGKNSLLFRVFWAFTLTAAFSGKFGMLRLLRKAFSSFL